MNFVLVCLIQPNETFLSISNRVSEKRTPCWHQVDNSALVAGTMTITLPCLTRDQLLSKILRSALLPTKNDKRWLPTAKKANISDRRAETYASRVGQMLVNVRRKTKSWRDTRTMLFTFPLWTQPAQWTNREWRCVENYNTKIIPVISI